MCSMKDGMPDLVRRTLFSRAASMTPMSSWRISSGVGSAIEAVGFSVWLLFACGIGLVQEKHRKMRMKKVAFQ